MAVSLFRRWRSQKFSDLVGQEAVVTTLQNVLTAGSPARAYLFCGPRGTGKTSSARIFAKALNCEKGPATEPCNECSQCRSIADGSNLDVFEIDAASHTQVDKIRDFIVEKVHFTPVSARYKVYIIDEVHKLSTSSFNALLKTLEEPPSHVVFVLATTHPHEMPPTILSRCQRYDFRPLSAAETERHLLHIAGEESIQLEGDAARQLARAADGSLRDALVLFEQAIVFSEGRAVTREGVLDLLGVVGYELLTSMLTGVHAGQSAPALRLLDDWVARGRDLRRLAENVQEHLRILMLLKVRASDQTVEHLSTDERTLLEGLAAQLTIATVMEWLRKTMELLSNIRQGRQARLEWEIFLVSLAHPEVDPDLTGLQQRIDRLEQRPAGAGAGGEDGASASSSLPGAADTALRDLQQRLTELESKPPASQPEAMLDPRLEQRLGQLEERLESQLRAPRTEEPAQSALVERLQRLEKRLEAALLERVPPADSRAPEAAPAPREEPAQAPPQPSPPPAPQPEASPLEPSETLDLEAPMPEPLVTNRSYRERFAAGPASDPAKEPLTSEPLAPKTPQVAEPRSAPEPTPTPGAPPPPRASEPPQSEPEPNVSQAPRTAAQIEPPAPPASKAQTAAETAQLPDPTEFWRLFMQQIKERDIRLHAVLADARLLALESGTFELGLPEGYEWHHGKLQEGRTLLEEIASRLAQTQMNLSSRLGGEKVAAPKESEHDDLVQRASGIFGGASIVD